MITFLGKFLFFMLIVVYCSQAGFNHTVVVVLYIAGMIGTAIVELIAWVKFDELIKQRSLSIEDSCLLDFISGNIPIIVLWTVFFAFCHVLITFFMLSMPLLAIAVAVLAFNSSIHLQRMERALK